MPSLASERRARARTERVCVAEKSRVWRCGARGRYVMMASSSRAKPRSSSRSASSSTSERSVPASKSGVCSRCCSSRPGVATTSAMRATRDCSSTKSRLPPVSSAAESACRAPTLRKTSKIWSASSRVGVTMSAPSPSPVDQRSRWSRSSTATRNASVLPEPVRAAPSTSRPTSACGMHAAWIAVGAVKPPAWSPALVRDESGISSKSGKGALGCEPGGGASAAHRRSSSSISPSSSSGAATGRARFRLVVTVIADEF